MDWPNHSSCQYQMLYIPIWFYSNLWMKVSVHSGKSSLHSNLVLFKYFHHRHFVACFKLYIPIWFYSNATSNSFTFALSKPFTFQSGSIQIAPEIKIAPGSKLLYIPIWFYSNALVASFLTMPLSLYIPIWFYSNEKIKEKIKEYLNFTFQSGSIQMRSITLLKLPLRTLHSNLVLFKYLVLFKFQMLPIYFTFQSGSIQINPQTSAQTLP